MTSTKHYPFDVPNLKKGDFIAPEICEALAGVTRADVKSYQLALMSLRDQLEKQWLREREEIITVVSSDDGLLICSDEAAVSTNDNRAQKAKKSLRRALFRQGGVDRSNLSDESIVRHDRSLRAMTAYVMAGRAAERAVLRPHVRQTPDTLGTRTREQIDKEIAEWEAKGRRKEDK